MLASGWLEASFCSMSTVSALPAATEAWTSDAPTVMPASRSDVCGVGEALGGVGEVLG